MLVNRLTEMHKTTNNEIAHTLFKVVLLVRLSSLAFVVLWCTR